MSTVDRAQSAGTATTVEAALPLLGLRITAGPIELRGITDDLLGPLADLAVEGISAPGGPPFLTPWKTEPPEDLPRFFDQYYWQLRAEFSPDRWTVPLAVLWDGEPAGVQELFGDKYLVNRTTETGSWLARRFQGRGIGTATRQVIAAFAFDHLDAQHVTSAAFSDNVASTSVSRKVGYTENGVDIWAREGNPVPHQRFLLSRGNLVRYEHPLMVTAVVAAGLVRREADQADGRRALLVRTPAGQHLSAQAHAFRRQVFGEAMADWPAADRAEFARLLRRFVQSLATVTAIRTN